jgi:hypothetical protein
MTHPARATAAAIVMTAAIAASAVAVTTAAITAAVTAAVTAAANTGNKYDKHDKGGKHEYKIIQGVDGRVSSSANAGR